MKIVIAALALWLGAGVAWADDTLVPTEGGEHTSIDQTGPDSGGCHRCVGNPDGGKSDSNYSNPEGAHVLGDGVTVGYDKGHSQDWYDNTGPYSGTGDCQGTCEVGSQSATDFDRQHATTGSEGRHEVPTQAHNGGRN